MSVAFLGSEGRAFVEEGIGARRTDLTARSIPRDFGGRSSFKHQFLIRRKVKEDGQPNEYEITVGGGYVNWGVNDLSVSEYKFTTALTEGKGVDIFWKAEYSGSAGEIYHEGGEAEDEEDGRPPIGDEEEKDETIIAKRLIGYVFMKNGAVTVEQVKIDTIEISTGIGDSNVEDTNHFSINAPTDKAAIQFYNFPDAVNKTLFPNMFEVHNEDGTKGKLVPTSEASGCYFVVRTNNGDVRKVQYIPTGNMGTWGGGDDDDDSEDDGGRLNCEGGRPYLGEDDGRPPPPTDVGRDYPGKDEVCW